MSNERSSPAPAPSDGETPKAPWGDLFRDGRTLYTVLVILGVALHALQILVIAIVMPTVVADLGGAAYYTWPAMLYTIGAIVGSASVGPVWAAFGARRGYAISALAFLVGTIGCAVAPDMAVLIAARGVQGYAGGLVVGGGMALVSGLYSAALRTRILAMYQGTWMVAQLMGPAVGGAFAQIGWWRGSFWTMVPFILCFAIIAWTRMPDRLESETAKPAGKFPIVRLALLAGGVFCVALAGPADGIALRVALIATGIGMIWFTFRRDKKSENRLYPSCVFSIFHPVGLAYWIIFLAGGVQTSVQVFLPLSLEKVYGVMPLFISFVTMVLSGGWTVGTFLVAGWSGARERLALLIGPLLMIASLAVMAIIVQIPTLTMLAVLTLASFTLGMGVGTHNVHLLSRTMAAADKGEESVTASGMTSIRNLGTAMGAALAGVLSHTAGLDDSMQAEAVSDAVSSVYGFGLIPLSIAALFMFRLLRLTNPDRAAKGDGAA